MGIRCVLRSAVSYQQTRCFDRPQLQDCGRFVGLVCFGIFDSYFKHPASQAPIDDLVNRMEGLHLCGFFRSIGSTAQPFSGYNPNAEENTGDISTGHPVMFKRLLAASADDDHRDNI